MMVVISIFAVLTLISATAFVATREQSKVDAAAEEILGVVREVQNHSISVENDSAGNATKVWSLAFYGASGTNTYQIESYYPRSQSPAFLDVVIEKAYTLPSGISATVTKVGGTLPLDEAHITFSSPFRFI